MPHLSLLTATEPDALLLLLLLLPLLLLLQAPRQDALL
jgi:hypothetical protein